MWNQTNSIGLSARLRNILSNRVEISTPLVGIYRLKEGYFHLKNGHSPYSGSSFHGSPLLLHLLGPFSDSLAPFLLANALTSFLLLSISARVQNLNPPLKSEKSLLKRFLFPAIATSAYFLNPMIISAALGGSTSVMDNAMIVLAVAGAVHGSPFLSSLGFVLAVHLALYPVVLIVPIILLLRNGFDRRPSGGSRGLEAISAFILWAVLFGLLLFASCWILLEGKGGIGQMINETYIFMVTARDLSPNIGIFWYFFSEIFHHARPFFLLLFAALPASLLLPLTLRLHHRPFFLAFIFINLISFFKFYPSLGDSALSLAFMPFFIPELQDIGYKYVLVIGTIYVHVTGPIMFNLWILKGVGNANFYYSVGLVNACLQAILIVQSVRAVIRFDKEWKRKKPTVKKDS